MHDQPGIAVQLRGRHGKQRIGAVAEGSGGTEGHKRIHIRRAVQQAAEAAEEEALVDDHDDDRQQHLGKAHGDMVARQEARQRPAPHHMAHGGVHQHEQKSDRRDKAALQLRRFMVLQRLECIGRPGGRRLRALALCAIARLRYSGDNRGLVCRSLNGHGVRQQAHTARRHTRHLGDCFFHAGTAGRAAHSGHLILFHRSHPFR